jgi:hypothetical protein
MEVQEAGWRAGRYGIAVIRAFGFVEHSLDLLFKESPCANGQRIDTLIEAYKLFSLRARREAVEARDRAAEQHFTNHIHEFDELNKCEEQLFAPSRPDRKHKVRATLKSNV